MAAEVASTMRPPIWPVTVCAWAPFNTRKDSNRAARMGASLSGLEAVYTRLVHPMGWRGIGARGFQTGAGRRFGFYARKYRPGAVMNSLGGSWLYAISAKR